MSELPAPPRSARAVARHWHALGAGPEASATFDPVRVTGLPNSVQRWLRRSIAPATPLATVAGLTMHGEIRLGAWR
ncbi:DUF6544 family protein [Rhodococcus sp. NPDC003318]|uniref:DUF6544 family protein n=1 Tax=Rhodococcus sp. NPDC003318 TaxID=3364503 RepID=UPI0036B51407